MGDKTPFLTLNYAQTGHFNLFKRIVLSHLNIKYIVIAYAVGDECRIITIIESLFTNVPIDAAVQAALQQLENDPRLCRPHHANTCTDR